MRISDLASEVISPTEAFVNAVYAQAAGSSSLPYALSYYPVASMNPFQRLLYCHAAASGFAVVPTLEMSHLGRVNWRGRSVIHLHWLAAVLRGAVSRSAAEQRIAGFRASLAGWRAAGHRVVWTMHNVLPHDCAFPEAEIELRRALVDGVDAIHLLSLASLEEARKYFPVPDDKVFHVPHPAYEGWYANIDDKVTARLDLDVPVAAPLLLFFGSLQRYKGVVELVEAFKLLCERNPRRAPRLVIAGKPIDHDYVAEVGRLVAGDTLIRFIPSPMEERQLQTLFNASDVVVAPYQRTLNSGVALLAASFRRPLVAPRAGGVLETFSQDATLLYSGDPGDTLFDALTRALDHTLAPEVFDEILERHAPRRISKAFFSELEARLFSGESTLGERVP